jgi:hypothetical protein
VKATCLNEKNEASQKKTPKKGKPQIKKTKLIQKGAQANIVDDVCCTPESPRLMSPFSQKLTESLQTFFFFIFSRLFNRFY